ncbi:MAG: hypothetical protein HY897_13120 [Deltaproteobacteria bacterium]|nr:hypothetical protein [Deltaproteobacteria bacterium]
MEENGREKEGLSIPLGLGAKLDRLVRRRVTDAIAEGFGSLFMSEELVRRIMEDLRLPREWLGTILAQTQKARKGIAEIVKSEVRAFLESVEFSEQLQKLLTSMVFEVKTEIRLVPAADGKLATKKKSRVKVRRARSR